MQTPKSFTPLHSLKQLILFNRKICWLVMVDMKGVVSLTTITVWPQLAIYLSAVSNQISWLSLHSQKGNEGIVLSFIVLFVLYCLVLYCVLSCIVYCIVYCIVLSCIVCIVGREWRCKGLHQNCLHPSADVNDFHMFCRLIIYVL